MNLPIGIYTFKDIFSEKDIEMFLDYIENIGNKSTPFTRLGTFENGKIYDPKLSQKMYELF
jgi:hypothetical protein